MLSCHSCFQCASLEVHVSCMITTIILHLCASLIYLATLDCTRTLVRICTVGEAFTPVRMLAGMKHKHRLLHCVTSLDASHRPVSTPTLE